MPQVESQPINAQESTGTFLKIATVLATVSGNIDDIYTICKHISKPKSEIFAEKRNKLFNRKIQTQ